jgi:hypothetical protein
LNPGFRDGDELVCITELTQNNLRGLAKRAFLQTLNVDLG